MRYALILIFPLVVGILMGMATDGMGWRKSALITVIVSGTMDCSILGYCDRLTHTITVYAKQSTLTEGHRMISAHIHQNQVAQLSVRTFLRFQRLLIPFLSPTLSQYGPANIRYNHIWVQYVLSLCSTREGENCTLTKVYHNVTQSQNCDN
jgi:hypothetical protein